MAYSRSLPELARIISERAGAIHNTYQTEGIQQPSFEYGTSHFDGPYPGSVDEDRSTLLEAIDELRSLIVGPAGHIFFMSFMGVSVIRPSFRSRLPPPPLLPQSAASLNADPSPPPPTPPSLGTQVVGRTSANHRKAGLDRNPARALSVPAPQACAT